MELVRLRFGSMGKNKVARLEFGRSEDVPVARSPAKVPPEEDAPQARPIRVRGFDRNPPLANANAKD